ncbi:hypothetical protein EGW08_022092 [Elysia chlorotica]|uniref:Uncharacterized protein n=1 Tax=Elysia chlorotica TaxID=188477 RepID=A0A3S1B2A2_ELYCH|nr:hypothetical protein EGW08_022092 [Elysia chlorotica]
MVTKSQNIRLQFLAVKKRFGVQVFRQKLMTDCLPLELCTAGSSQSWFATNHGCPNIKQAYHHCSSSSHYHKKKENNNNNNNNNNKSDDSYPYHHTSNNHRTKTSCNNKNNSRYNTWNHHYHSYYHHRQLSPGVPARPTDPTDVPSHLLCLPAPVGHHLRRCCCCIDATTQSGNLHISTAKPHNYTDYNITDNHSEKDNYYTDNHDENDNYNSNCFM